MECVATSGSCDPVNGVCVCPPGRTGVNCDEDCPAGMYGRDCLQSCDCQNAALCHSVTGECQCQPGFIGNRCEEPCPPHLYGNNCTYKCRCLNGASCSNFDGECICTPGFSGIDCGEACPKGFYGTNCSSPCKCNGKQTILCNAVSGRCECDVGYRGETCDRDCVKGTYGLNCQFDCRCGNRALCDPKDGSCTCLDGWTGPDCLSACPVGMYGKNCVKECSCPEKSDCDPVNGSCICPPGLNDDRCKPAANMGRQESQESFDPKLFGAIIGGLLLILLIVLIIFFMWRRQREDKSSNLSVLYATGYESPQTIFTTPVQAESNGTIPNNAVLFTNLPDKDVDSTEYMGVITKIDNFDSGKGFPKNAKRLNSYEVAPPWLKEGSVSGGDVNQFDGNSVDKLNNLEDKGAFFVSKQDSDNPPPYQSEENLYADIDDLDIHPKTEYSSFPNNKPISPSPDSPNHLPNMYSNVSNRRSHPVPPLRNDLL